MLQTNNALHNFPHIDIISPKDTKIFMKKYFNKEAVLVKGYLKESKAFKTWNEDYLLNLAGEGEVEVWKNKSRKILIKFKEYVEWLIQNQNTNKKDNASPAEESLYLTNFHIYKINNSIAKVLSDDLNFVPNTFVGKWYLKDWKKNIFLFYGNKNSVTPLHFDVLGTHNTFFQIKGNKRFIILPSNQIDYCYIDTRKSAFSKIDLEKPDYEKYPLLKKITPSQAILEGGDMLYMPPFALHHVRGLNLNISMNLDWHSKQSVINSLFSESNKHLKTRFTNFITFLGVCCGIPNHMLFRFLKSYYDIIFE